MCKWFDGEEVRTEAAETARSKMESLHLTEGNNASDYVNKFLNYYRYLEKIPGEEYSKSHAVQKFLANIKDKNYAGTVSFCRNSRLSLDECVSKIRLNERELSRSRREEKRFRGVARRLDVDLDIEEESSRTNKVRRLDESSKETLTVRPSGRIAVHPSKWKKLDETVKEYVRNYNAAVNHKEDVEKVTIPPNVTVQKSRKLRSVQSMDVPTQGGPSEKVSKSKKITFNLEGDCAKDE